MYKAIGIIAIFLIICPLTYINAQTNLTVEIVTLESNKGFVIVDLMDKNEESVMDLTSEIKDNKCTLIFKDLENGQYAIRYFHDENKNEELDTNFIGIPKEGFGFSNNAIGKFGPKDFREWLFEISGDTSLTMTTKYMF